MKKWLKRFQRQENIATRGISCPYCTLVSLAAVMYVLLWTTGCSSSSRANGTATPLISVSITQAPPATMPTSTSASVSAAVNNDIANAGVDWVAMCASGPNCGSFSPAHTASGSAATFTAPNGVPSGNTVAVTALSTTDHSKAFAATVTITSTVTGITISQPPPASYTSGGSIKLTANVAGDPSNAGVDWKANCGGIDCSSSFFGAHSAPGVPTTFVVPIQSSTYPAIVGSTVTITAFATADHNFSAVATFVVTSPISISITQVPPNSLLTNSSAAVIAVVTNDPTNSGVTWTIESCDAAPCGSWSATIPEVGTTQTASGAPAVYFAPPMAVNHVKIQAAATASPASGVATVEISITAPISIAITKGITNDSIVKNGTASLVATVSDDATKAGVDWTVSCSSTGACGSFSLGHTDSGSPTTFTAPAAVPADNTVTITATSTADGTKSVSEIVTVTAGILPNSLLSGQFVISLSGEDANGGPYSLGGVIVCDGVGNITKGSLDLVDLGGGVGNTNAGNVPVLASTYSIGSDGRGQIQLKVK